MYGPVPIGSWLKREASSGVGAGRQDGGLLHGQDLLEHGVGGIGVDPHGVLVDGFHLRDVLEGAARGHEVRGGVDDPLERVDDVVAAEVAAVVELDALAEFELERRVVDPVPGGGQAGLEAAGEEVAVDEAVGDGGEGAEAVGADVDVDRGVQAVG